MPQTEGRLPEADDCFVYAEGNWPGAGATRLGSMSMARLAARALGFALCVGAALGVLGVLVLLGGEAGQFVAALFTAPALFALLAMRDEPGASFGATYAAACCLYAVIGVIGLSAWGVFRLAILLGFA